MSNEEIKPGVFTGQVTVRGGPMDFGHYSSLHGHNKNGKSKAEGYRLVFVTEGLPSNPFWLPKEEFEAGFSRVTK